MDRAAYLDRLSNAWRVRDDINVWKAPRQRWNDPQLTPLARKAALSRAWLNPPRPRTWDLPIIDPVRTVTVPAASNPSKGGSPGAEEVEAARAARQAEFERQLAAQHQWNLNHL